jgi:uncharacterized protein YdhG (YjbR/CyaY superfamily)
MAAADIDAYLAEVDEPKRSTLEALRRTILELRPGAEQTIAYGTPTFKVNGKAIAGFAAFKHHLSYLPHSSNVLSELQDELADYQTSKGALRFAIDVPLPKALVEKLIDARLRELGLD